MVDRQVVFLNPVRLLRGNTDANLAKFDESPAGLAGESDGPQAARARCLHRVSDVAGVPRGTECNQDISGTAEPSGQLREHQIRGDVVTKGTAQSRKGGEGNRGDGALQVFRDVGGQMRSILRRQRPLFGEPFKELAGPVISIGSTPAVAAKQNLSARFDAALQCIVGIADGSAAGFELG